MAQAITVSQDILTTILRTLRELKADVEVVKEKLDTLPAYGSSEWWELAIKQGEEAIDKGEYVTVKSDKDLDKLFASL